MATLACLVIMLAVFYGLWRITKQAPTYNATDEQFQAILDAKWGTQDQPELEEDKQDD